MNPIDRYPITLEGYDYWYQHYPFQKIDQHLKQFLSIESDFNQWLKYARKALFLSVNSVATTLGISRQAYCNIENSEKLGSVKLDTLKRAAEAIGCELVYAIRPKSQKKFSQVIWEQLHSDSKNHCWVASRPEHLKSRALAAICRDKMNDPKVRLKSNWTKRRS